MDFSCKSLCFACSENCYGICDECQIMYNVCLNCIYYGKNKKCLNCEHNSINDVYDIQDMFDYIKNNKSIYVNEDLPQK